MADLTVPPLPDELRQWRHYLHASCIPARMPERPIHAVLDAAADRIASLQARLEAAERDAARLDWLEQQANEPGGLLLHAESDTGRLGLGLAPGQIPRSLRAAIDAATQEGKG
jgi:hypothetical protein